MESGIPHPPAPHILCTGEDYAHGGGEYESRYSMVHTSAPSTGLPKPMPRALGQIPRGAQALLSHGLCQQLGR